MSLRPLGLCLALAAGCNEDVHSTFAGAVDLRYVVNSITLPKSGSEFAIDLNGDGKPDNALGKILCPRDLSFPEDPCVETSEPLGDGALIELITLHTTDPSRTSDPAVQVTLARGLPSRPPDFTGHGQFAIDGSAASGTLAGAIVAGTISTEDPVTTTHPVTVPFALRSAMAGVGGALFPLTVRGAHVRFTAGTDAASGAPGLVAGELHGSIKQEDFASAFAAFEAVDLTAQVCTGGLDANLACKACGTSTSVMQILTAFDSGGCGEAKAGDCVIDACEVARNRGFNGIVAPDVQIYDAVGNYAPNPMNTKPDSLSLGIRFTAVQATY